MPADLRGCPTGSDVPAARAAAEQALWRMMSFYDVPLADLDAAAAHDPGWALPHVMKAGFLASLTEPAVLAEATAALATARTLTRDAPAREQRHLDAVQQVLDGRWQAACRTWDELLLEHPTDALALQWAHLWDFYRGDSPQLRQRPARALPAWAEGDPLRPLVMGLYAFGLEENNLYAQAEDAAREALALDPRGPWAVHAVAHVMEMQGRHEEGGVWLRQHQAAWAEGNGFACHLWWHKALFRLEALDTAGVLRLIDTHLSGAALQITLNRVDAASMLWRLHLLGEDVSALAAAVADGWDTAEAACGYYAFNDVHHVLALLAAGRVAAAEAWTARCATRALDAEDARRSNHPMSREVGLPLMRALIAHARGAHDEAAAALYAVRGTAQRFGGSHAQRDLIDLSLLAAAARGSRRDIGRALINERRLAKPVTPLTRHWIEQMGTSELAYS
ncbi:MAG: tetratricopeptide repeat protein [Rubrivivax sp.]|jgi:tetratricopeptide (TPR) repeat protein|nr:tetratricopeptide repeat protein [Rubrivivax sp.]